jgi:hypothetical protein
MPIKFESIGATAFANVDQLAIKLVSENAPNTMEFGTDGLLLVRLPEDQDFTPDLVEIYRNPPS